MKAFLCSKAWEVFNDDKIKQILIFLNDVALCFFFGFLGVHRFYVGKNKTVNTATGEKSGEMLAVAKFAATNGQPELENQNPGGQSEGGNQGGGAGGDENPEQGLGF